jgi:hypothetical protein
MKEHLVNTARRISTLAYRVGLATSLFVLAGCRGDNSPGEDHDHDHIGHVIPAHKPKAFPEAVHRLRELNDRIARGKSEGQPAAAPDDRTLNIALDIANWLPEIAAESDIPEKEWNEVNARSAAIVADYQTILSGTAADARTGAASNAGRAISDLETLLAGADPRWFAGPEKQGTAP